MSRRASALPVGILAFLSGIPALVYQVVWTRQLALVAGGQIEAISVVLVVFFGGLGLGNQLFGSIADRTASALRLYARLEIAAALLAAGSVWALRQLEAFPQLGSAALLGASALALLPVTVLLGGTLPALLRWIASDPGSTAGRAGILVGANTTGAVLGIGFAVTSIPALGLRASLLSGAALAFGLGLAVLPFARPRVGAPAAEPAPRPIAARILVTAFIVGAATLGFEVLAARLATLRLGSSLYAWGLVLALFLVGLAAGNLAASGRARTTRTPAIDLGWIELAAACCVALGIAGLRPDLAAPGAALSAKSLARVSLCVLPGTFCMGAAFPLLVRLAMSEARIATTFGRISAVNTGGGIAGSLIAPFVLLPGLGSVGGALTLAAANAGVAVVFLASASSGARARRLAIAFGLLAAAFAPALRPTSPAPDPWVLFVAEGRQASAVVTGSQGHRTLSVDGDPEASTAGDARRTEELLAVLPLLLHPKPERFLEIGLGSGITLGTAARFPLQRLDCVEIAASVIRAARFFEPDNRGVARDEGDEVDEGRISIIHSDARRLLAHRTDRYDVISANTLHPWSVGATGLYSFEYFSRIANALRPGGLAVQWLPIQQIGSETLGLVLRTFFAVFPEGALWWGAGNVIALGSRDPLPEYDAARAGARLAAAGIDWQRLGWTRAEELPTHLIADADSIRAVLGPGDLLLDDRPLLERHAARGRLPNDGADLVRILVEIAEQDVGRGAMLFWLQSLELRASGDESGADVREALAADLGLRIARRAAVDRRVMAALADARAGRIDGVAERLGDALAHEPDHRDARLGRARLALRAGDVSAAIRDLEALVATRPDDALAWSELASAQAHSGNLRAARSAIRLALAANPFDIQVLSNAGLLAARDNERARAREMLERIRDLSPLGRSTEEEVLQSVLARIGDP